MQAKVYRLTGGRAPLYYILQSRHKAGKPLTFLDPKTKKSRQLRYATNHDTPFADEQKGEVMLGDIVFKDGMLRVDETDTALDKFLKVHPDYSKKYELVDKQKEAAEQLEELDLEYEAYSKAKSLSMNNVEKLGRVLFGYNPANVKSQEIRRDVVLFARNNPEDFLHMLDDPEMDSKSELQELKDANVISLRNKDREVFFNLQDNKSKIVTVGQGETWQDALKRYFESDTGLQVYKMLMSVVRTKK